MNWPAYTAAAGAALALATGASASIIYSGPENITATAGGPATGHSTQALHVGAGNFHLKAAYSAGSVVAGLLELSAASHLSSVGHNNSNGIRRLGSGSRISVGGPAWASHGVLQIRTSAFSRHGTGGTWVAGETEFAGIRFKAGTGPFDFDYGWIRLVVGENGNGYPATVTALDWAYNNVTGASINAGEGLPSTPEPGTMALALLAAGSAAVTTLRRRRAQAVA